MRVTANREARLVPAFLGNRNLPNDEQIVIVVEFPTTLERENLKGYSVRDNGEISINFNVKKILEKFVKSIENLEDDYNGAVKNIKTGKELAESKNPNLSPLIDEIKTYILQQDSLQEAEGKNSDAPSS